MAAAPTPPYLGYTTPRRKGGTRRLPAGERVGGALSGGLTNTNALLLNMQRAFVMSLKTVLKTPSGVFRRQKPKKTRCHTIHNHLENTLENP